MTDKITGSRYLERGQPVTVLKRWAQIPAVAVSAIIWIRPPKASGPRNVAIRRADGSEVVRPFRGLRKIKGEDND